MEIEKVYTFELDSRHTPGTFCGYLTAPSEEVAKELVNSFGGKFGGPMELPIIPQSEFGVGFIRVSQAKLSEFDDFTKFLEAIKDQIPSDATIELVAQAIEDGVYINSKDVFVKSAEWKGQPNGGIIPRINIEF